MNDAAVFFRLTGSLLYNESNAADIAYMKEEGIFSDIPYAVNNPLVVKGQQDVNEWLLSLDAEKLAEAAASDYMKLFIGVGKVLAPPWSSCYTAEERLIFQKETLLVREYYSAYGMELKKKYAEPDDHIGLELEFLSHLLEQGENEAAAHFVQTHMKPWIYNWLEAVEQFAMTGYYRGLARMAVGAVEQMLWELSASKAE